MNEKRYIISDAAKLIDVEPHVLRYWEEELGMDIPRNEMGHRYYTDKEVRLFTQVRDLKEKGFQLKAIKMILSTVAEETPGNNIISLDKVRKNYGDGGTTEGYAGQEPAGMSGPMPQPHNIRQAQAAPQGPGSMQTQNVRQPQSVLQEQGRFMDADMQELEGGYGNTPVAEAAVDRQSRDKAGATEHMPDDGQASGSGGALSLTEEVMVQAISAEDKMKHFKYIMDGIVMQALKKNNQALEEQVTGKVIKEMDYLFRIQEEKDEERFRCLDEMIRIKQKGRKEAAAAKAPAYAKPKKKRLFHKKEVF